MSTFFHKLASPPHIYDLAAKMIPWFGGIAIVLIASGTYVGLFIAPTETVQGQGDAFRIIFVHVPSAFLSLMAYMLMAVASGIGLIWRIKLGFAFAAAAAPLGAWFTFLALATGAIWGRPIWNMQSWWEWGDPRLTSELILLFLYFGYMALRAAIDDTAKADKASSVLALVGAVNVPIIHYSVEVWTSLHQKSTLLKLEGPSMLPEHLTPLLTMIVGFTFLFGALLLIRVRGEVLNRERRANWVRELLLPRTAGA